MLGLNINSTSKDFLVEDDKISLLTGRDLLFRNFTKLLMTEAGDILQTKDTRKRYNAQYGLDYNKMYGAKTDSLSILDMVKNEVERICSRFIQNQKTYISYRGEDEVISRYAVTVEKLSDVSVRFNILLWTVEDVRLRRSPSFDKTFST